MTWVTYSVAQVLATEPVWPLLLLKLCALPASLQKEPSQATGMLDLQAFFAGEWTQLVEASFRNLVAEAAQGLPLPALLRFDADRAARLALRDRCAELEAQNARMAQVRRSALRRQGAVVEAPDAGLADVACSPSRAGLPSDACLHTCPRRCGSGWRRAPAAQLPSQPRAPGPAQPTGASWASTWWTPTTWTPARPRGAPRSPSPARSRLRRPPARARCAEGLGGALQTGQRRTPCSLEVCSDFRPVLLHGCCNFGQYATKILNLNLNLKTTC